MQKATLLGEFAQMATRTFARQNRRSPLQSENPRRASYREESTFPLHDPRAFRAWVCERVAERACPLLEVVDGRITDPYNSRRKSAALREVANLWGLSYREVYRLAHESRKRLSYTILGKIRDWLIDDRERRDFLAVALPPAVHARREEYEDSSQTATATLAKALQNIDELRHWPGDPSRTTALGRACTWFRKQSRARGVPPYRLKLAEWRALERLESFSRLKQLPARDVEWLLKASLRTELYHIEAERKAYALMYGRKEPVGLRSTMSQISPSFEERPA
jgi:hypothetical protein